MAENRKLAAILASDVVGYSRLAAADEERTLARLRTLRSDLIDPIISVHKGRVVKRTGDGSIVEFRSVVDAVRCALEVQNGIRDRNAGVPQDQRIIFRIGIHLGDVVEESDGDLMGDGVNIAARLETHCEPNGVCLSAAAYEQVRDRIREEFVDLGDLALKNIARPVRAYAVVPDLQAARKNRALSATDRPSIAVLPFQNMSGDPEQEYFADGIVEDILTALARFPQMQVTARNSSFVFKGRTIDIKEVGQTLRVRYVLEGSVRKSGNRVRITAQLIQAQTGAHLWADKFDGDLTDIFTLQDEITERVVTSIEPLVKSAEYDSMRRNRPTDINAYDLYLRALAAYHEMDRKGLADAIDLLRNCMSIDPRYGPAASLCSIALAQLVAMGGASDVKAAVAETLRLGQVALDTSRNDADILAWAGRTFAWAGADCGAAIELVDRAVLMNPNSPNAWCQRGWVYVYAQRPREALRDFERAIRIGSFDQTLFDTLAGRASACIALEDYDQAAQAAQSALNQNPRYATAWRMMAAAHAGLGRRLEAEAAAQKLLELDPTFTISGWAGRAGKWQSPQLLDGLRRAGLPA